MNLILFEAGEWQQRSLPRSDPRARHLCDVLRRRPGDTFEAGIIDGPRGLARVESLDDSTLTWSFQPGPPLPSLPETWLLIGLPRPQTARDILRDATTLGATVLVFVRTERSDPNYASSSLWTSGEWRRHVVAGAMQGNDPRLPRVIWDRPLPHVAAQLPNDADRYALDNYEATTPLASVRFAASRPAVLALGPERGWGAADRDVLRQAGFTLAGLGPRVLRLETAVIAALTLAAAHRGPA